MALFNCPDCNKEISDRASTCVGCGYPIASLKSTTNCGTAKASYLPPFSQQASANQSSYNVHTAYQQNYAPSQEFYYLQLLQQNEQAAKKAATTSLVCGVIGLFIGGLIFGIIAIAQGNKAKRLGYIGKDASTGIVLGVISMIGWFFIICIWII
ncbi:MAG: DUF4190 domain-containing protein [Oscillospiraceae bacterium]|nr:DUF4190 domain-containing protein [Oscillospiraceae bacterium]